MRPRVRTALILLVTIGLLAFFLRDADMAGVWAETRRADARLLSLALLVTLGTYLIRAWRWQSMLAPLGPTRFSTALRTTIIGFAASAVLPARAGEVLRPYLLARREHLNATAAFATIIIERLIDLATVLVLFGVFVFFVPESGLSGEPGQLAHVKFWGGLASAGAVVGMIVLFALAGHPERLGRAALRIERVLPARIAAVVARFVETFAQGLAVMRSPVRLLETLALSFPLWLSIALQIWLTSQAFHITFAFTGTFLVMRSPVRLLETLALSFPLWLSIALQIWLTSQAFHITFAFTGTFLVILFLVVGVAVPTPGQIGGFHAAYQIAVTTFFAVPADRAVGAAIVLHAISFLPVLGVGLVLMAREGLTFSGARELAEQGAR